jgi:hypothetical protein
MCGELILSRQIVGLHVGRLIVELTAVKIHSRAIDLG